jgi:hypothetical protein
MSNARTWSATLPAAKSIPDDAGFSSWTTVRPPRSFTRRKPSTPSLPMPVSNTAIVRSRQASATEAIMMSIVARSVRARCGRTAIAPLPLSSSRPRSGVK